MTATLAGAAALAGLLVGVALGYRYNTATRTWREARGTTRAARALWRRVPRDWARVGEVAGWVFLAGLVVVAYRLGRD